MITEISVYLPDTPGQFSKLLKVLADGDVNIRGFSVDLAGPYSQVRLVFDDAAKAGGLLKDHGFVVKETDVFVLSMRDKPGALLRVADLMGREGINIEYGYVTLGWTESGEPVVVLKVEKEKVELAKKYLRQARVEDHDRIPEPTATR